MRYLKLFEQLGQTYFEIHYSEYYGLEVSKREDFDEKDIEYMEKLSRDMKSHGFCHHLAYEFLFCDRKITLYIRKYIDDWYFICLEDATDIDNQSEYFYKCDQFDGLVDCINFIKSYVKNIEDCKAFENVQQLPYQLIDYDTYLIERSERRRIPFTDSEISFIKSYDFHYPAKITSNNRNDNFQISVRDVIIYLYKSDDEYYYIMANDGDILLDGIYCYRCDQWDGFVSCIENKVSKLIK